MLCTKSGNKTESYGTAHIDLEFWEPIYEEEFKEGDWIYIENGGFGALGINGNVGQIVPKPLIKPSNYTGETYSEAKLFIETNGEIWGLASGYIIRKATEKEITENQSIFIASYKAWVNGDAIGFGSCQQFPKKTIQTLATLLANDTIKAKLIIRDEEVTLKTLNKLLLLLP